MMVNPRDQIISWMGPLGHTQANYDIKLDAGWRIYKDGRCPWTHPSKRMGMKVRFAHKYVLKDVEEIFT